MPEEFFSAERIQVGERSADLVGARNISRELDTDIDKLFPPFKTIANKQTAKNRDKLLAEMNDVLLSGEPKMDADGLVTFGKIDKTASDKLIGTLKNMEQLMKQLQVFLVTLMLLEVSGAIYLLN